MNPRLGINIDHIATLRQARRVSYPDPVASLAILVDCGVDQVTLHLREDRRHIQDHDLKRICESHKLPVNLEMAVTDEMVGIALKFKPHTVTFVPEKREEITTEGGLDCASKFSQIKEATKKLKDNGIRVSLFIDAVAEQVRASGESGANAIEIHTGTYCNVIEAYYEHSGTYDYQQDTATVAHVHTELEKIKSATAIAMAQNLKVFAGHGLHCNNLAKIVKITDIEEYNIGHAIIARAVFVGLEKAIKEIKNALCQ